MYTVVRFVALSCFTELEYSSPTALPETSAHATYLHVHDYEIILHHIACSAGEPNDFIHHILMGAGSRTSGQGAAAATAAASAASTELPSAATSAAAPVQDMAADAAGAAAAAAAASSAGAGAAAAGAGAAASVGVGVGAGGGGSNAAAVDAALAGARRVYGPELDALDSALGRGPEFRNYLVDGLASGAREVAEGARDAAAALVAGPGAADGYAERRAAEDMAAASQSLLELVQAVQVGGIDCCVRGCM